MRRGLIGLVLAGLIGCAAPVLAQAGAFSDWAAVVVAGDWRAHSGAPSEVFDNARRDVARSLVSAGFAPDPRCIDIVAAPAPPEWKDREKYPEMFVIDELRCIYCGMCEQACPCDAIELTSMFDLTGLSREDMMFDKEKLLSVFDQTAQTSKDPVRTKAGPLSCASEPNL